MYIADRKATTGIGKAFLLRCVNPAALPLVRCDSIRHPRRVASWVNYSSRRTESSSEHFASDLSLLKADALWCENRRCSDSNPWPMNPKASVHPLHQGAQRSIRSSFLRCPRNGGRPFCIISTAAWRQCVMASGTLCYAQDWIIQLVKNAIAYVSRWCRGLHIDEQNQNA